MHKKIFLLALLLANTPARGDVSGSCYVNGGALSSDAGIIISASPPTANTTGSGSSASATVGTGGTTLTAPAQVGGFILMNVDTSTTNLRWAIGRTASATLGQQLQPGRDTGFIPVGSNVSIAAESGTVTYDMQWVSK